MHNDYESTAEPDAPMATEYEDNSAALAAWLAFEQGGLDEAPMALAAWLVRQRFPEGS